MCFLKEGRLVPFTGSRELRGTPASPEPISSRVHLHDDEDFVQLGRKAGFVGVRVERPDLERFAHEAGVPEEHIQLFAGRTGAAPDRE